MLCEKTSQSEGDCCPRCEEEDLCLSDQSDGFLDNSVCHHNGTIYGAGETWAVDHKGCTQCKCKVSKYCPK